MPARVNYLPVLALALTGGGIVGEVRIGAPPLRGRIVDAVGLVEVDNLPAPGPVRIS